MAAALRRVNMGPPQLDWRDIPLAQDVDTLALPIDGAPTATGMGNPHCTFFVADAEAVDLAQRGAEMEHHPLFPDRTNVQFASLHRSKPVAHAGLGTRCWRDTGFGIVILCSRSGGGAAWPDGSQCPD